MKRRLFYCDHHPIPLPPRHRFPIEKYTRLRALLTAEQRAGFDALPKPGPRSLREPGMGPMARGEDGMARDESPMACDMGAMGCDRRPREPANAMPPAATDPPLPGAEPSRLEEDGP